MKSDKTKIGKERAPHRSLFYAMGYTDEELDRPIIGVVNSANEIIPGHAHLDTIAEAVKAGIRMAGGTPMEFPAIGVCDGIAMNHEGMKYSLVTRELIADSVECVATAHAFDGLVMIPNCDKIVPGMLMAAARLDVPTVFVSGGPMLAGRYNGKRLSLTSMFEAVGAVAAGKMDEAELREMEKCACPTCGSCSGMFTANSMNCVTEVLGMGLPGNGTIPAVYADRIALAKKAGMAVMDLVKRNVTARQIMTAKAFDNALGRGHGSRLQLEYGASPSGDRARGRRPDRPQKDQRDFRAYAESLPARPGRNHVHRRSQRGGRYLCRSRRARQTQPHRYLTPDRHRKDHRRKYRGRRQQESRDHPPD